MLRFGTISEIDPIKGLARVRFEEDNIVSGWIPIVQRRTLSDKSMETMDINEHVACLMDEHAEEGVIVGAIFNDTDLPDGGGADVWARKFKDGTVIKYDRAAKKLTATLASGGTAEVTATEVKIIGNLVVEGNISTTSGGSMEVEGSIKANGQVSAMAATPATEVKLSTHVHPGTGSPPTPGT